MSRMQAVGDIVNPFGFGHHHHHHHNGFVEGAIIAGEINMIERERLRQMEMAAGRAYVMPPVGAGAYYPPAPGYAVS